MAQVSFVCLLFTYQPKPVLPAVQAKFGATSVGSLPGSVVMDGLTKNTAKLTVWPPLALYISGLYGTCLEQEGR